jgi:hypothetical protein
MHANERHVNSRQGMLGKGMARKAKVRNVKERHGMSGKGIARQGMESGIILLPPKG